MKRQFLVILCCLFMCRAALAEGESGAERAPSAALQVPDSDAAAESEAFSEELHAAYLWDGGALPFVYGSAAVALGLRLFVAPAESPRLFPASEGGASVHADTVPELALGLIAGGGAGLIAALPSVGRLHHFKGYLEALLTTIAVTEITKNAIGRHRPTYQPGDTDDDLRRSFFSGHASVTAVSTVYLGLYLNKHVLPRLRGPFAPTLRLLTLGALGAALVGVPYSRLRDHRHHLSDVTTGAVVGSALALSFYVYQEGRLMRSQEAFYRGKRQRMIIVPDIKNRGLSLVSVW